MMIANKEILKKRIIYRSKRRGSKEMDLLLGNFVKKYIDKLSEHLIVNQPPPQPCCPHGHP